ncbi:hypothetical protein J8244_09485 [Corynebacterium tuberculostearicum]|uniref:hypothetical protein n=1 Tax=Corynebacterium tuberculostearicum TaxID=38304 RepID=UPI0026663C1A|nr:hypothetical protein [Corynebacterium tuberculostearicum]WKE50353.1 hypothetical protein J8244_09485 [Corynebacterium tuberculostearicum]
MRIDYDHLRRVVAEMKQGVAATTKYTWLDLAQENLRLQKRLRAIRRDLHESTLCNGGTDVPYLQGITEQAVETGKQIAHLLGEDDD